MDSIAEQIRARAIAQAEDAAGYSVFKVRLITDDGWYYFTARNNKAAEAALADIDGVNPKVWGRATAREVEVIAVRALRN